jgi:hypothetical protein
MYIDKFQLLHGDNQETTQVPVGVVFQNKHIFENLRLVFDFFFLHFGLRETESGFEKHILYTRNYYKLGESYSVVKDLFLLSPLHTVS